jgi:hypothetical protein
MNAQHAARRLLRKFVHSAPEASQVKAPLMKSHDKEVDLLLAQKLDDCVDFATFYDVTLDLDAVGMGGASGLLLQNLVKPLPIIRQHSRK